MQENASLYHAMLRIRRFEETVLEQFSKGHFYGTTHTYLGQEADAVGVLKHLGPDDVVVSNHRGHGHFLAYGGDMRALFAELMGRATGIGGGRGGSQHLHWHNFYSNGILGGTAPLATGMALAEKIRGSGAVTICFLGDGALGEGVVYEAFNMASLWSLPILYVLENNRIAQSTPIERNLAGTIAGRFTAFGIPATELETSDVLVIAQAAAQAMQAVRGSWSALRPAEESAGKAGRQHASSFENVRPEIAVLGSASLASEQGDAGAPTSPSSLPPAGLASAPEAGEERIGPRALILNTQRFGPHSKGDDSRPAEQVARLRRDFDPLAIHGQRLEEAERAAIQARVEAEVRAAFQAALVDPLPGPESLVADGERRAG